MNKIIDVSEYQGNIDWKKVRATGMDFAILKITKKTNKPDGKFYANASGCDKEKIGWDVYKYSYAKDEASSEAEAKAIVNILRGMEAEGTTVWWDMEDYTLRNLGKAKLTRNVKAAQRIVEAAGYTFGIYCNKDWYNNILDVKEFDCPFWIARYPYTNILPLNYTPNVKYKPVTKYGHKLVGWQYTSKGRVDGVAGNVDISMLYV